MKLPGAHRNPEIFFLLCFLKKCHTALKSGGIEIDILQLPAIRTLSARINSGRMSSDVQTGLENQGRDYNSAVYPQQGKQIIVHHFLYVLESFLFGNPYC